MDKVYKESLDIADKLSFPQKQEVGSKVAEKWRESSNQIQHLLEESLEGWDYYLNNRPASEALRGKETLKAQGDAHREETPHGVRLGYIPKAVNSMVAQYMASTFPTDGSFFSATPQNDLSRENKELYERYLQHRFSKSNLEQTMRNVFLNMILDGTACVHITHKQKKVKKTVWEKDTVDIMGMAFESENLVKRVKDVVVYDGPEVSCLSFNDWRVDPAAKCQEESYFIRRWYEPVHKVKEDYAHVEGIEDLTSYGSTVDEWYEQDKADSFGLDYWEPAYEKDGLEDEALQNAMLMVMYDDFVVANKVYKNYVAVVANDRYLLYFGPNPHNHGQVPYVIVPYLEVPGQLYGLSMVKHALPSAEFVDRAYQIILDSSLWGAVPMFYKVMTDPQIRKQGDIQPKPGLMIPVMSPGAVQQVPINLMNLTTLYQLIQTAEKNIEDVTGANPYIQGEQAQQGRVSAFETENRIQGGNSRINAILQIFNNRCLETLLYQAHENDKQYCTEDGYVHGEVLPLPVLRQLDFDFTATALQAVMTKQRRLAQYEMLLTQLMPGMFQNQLATPNAAEGLQLNVAEVFMGLLQESGFPDRDKIAQVISREQQAQGAMQSLATPPAIAGDIGANNVQSQPNLSRMEPGA